MNELETQLSKVLEKAIEIAEQTGEFAIEQAPLLLQEFYRWHIMQSALGIAFSIAAFFIVSNLYRFFGHKEIPSGKSEKKYRLVKGYYYYYDVAIDLSGSRVFFKIISPLIFIWTAICIYKLAYILVAPKLYLIEYFIK